MRAEITVPHAEPVLAHAASLFGLLLMVVHDIPLNLPGPLLLSHKPGFPSAAFSSRYATAADIQKQSKTLLFKHLQVLGRFTFRFYRSFPGGLYMVLDECACLPFAWQQQRPSCCKV